MRHTPCCYTHNQRFLMNDANITVGQLRKQLVDMLTDPRAPHPVDPDEAVAMVRELMRLMLGFSPTDMVVKADYVPDSETVSLARRMVSRVCAGEPLQYVTGHAWFHGLDIHVTPDVLIPRPETSQLVDIIADAAAGASDLRVLDIGTGSGCIAIALALTLPFSQVTGLDISRPALAVARDNAARLHARVDFVEGDALSLSDTDSDKYDIIVSNPPYVLDSERSAMDPRVSHEEPSSALFVPDSDPLRFYKPIARYAAHALASGGRLYFEINPLCTNDIRTMLTDLGFADVDILRDYKGNYRFASCRR